MTMPAKGRRAGGGARGHAEPRTWESEAKHQRQFALGVGPQRQWKDVAGKAGGAAKAATVRANS
jgi:hypothetical protein